ncbi:MAG: Lrp/AsnC ligand binding domain-containing protein, partial [Bacteroidota bacterium]
TCAFVQIMSMHARYLPPILRKLETIPEIVDCVNIAGRYAIMVKIYAINNQHLRDIVYDKIQTIEGVEGTNTVVAFETAFSREVPLEVS